MAQVVVTKSKIDAIVDAVNTKAGTTGTMSLDAIPTAIANIPSGGGDTLGYVTATITYGKKAILLGNYTLTNNTYGQTLEVI